MGNLFAHAVAQKAHKEGILDIRGGFNLFRSRNVPVGMKATALSIGAFGTALLMMIELPLEPVVGVLLPLVGFAVDAIVDGAEIVMLPLLIGAAVLPHLQRRAASKVVVRVD